jgi:hypothetical protein
MGEQGVGHRRSGRHIETPDPLDAVATREHDPFDAG